MNYVTREKARASGLKWFFVGQKCRKGHVAQRFVSNSDCRECHNARVAASKVNVRRTADKHEFYLRYRMTYMLSGAKKRAQRDGLPFDITLADLTIPERCPVLGIKLVSSRGRPSDASPSLDKIRPERGYVRGNIAIISNRANRLKMNATAAELRMIADWMESQ